ncbi:MAG: hypothetical protein M0Q42_08270 [Xanthomonadales bacterium]|nr:hypothetical protein [Xanthomonadales bacterium]
MSAVLAVLLTGALASARPAPDQPSAQPVMIGGFQAPSWQAPVAGDQVVCPERLFADGYQSGVPEQAGGVGRPIRYRSFGGYRLTIDKHTIMITDPAGMNTIEHWGDPHENLNGKHIKDWGGLPGWSQNRRSLVLGDGSKLTLSAAGWNGVVQVTWIYDRGHHVQIDNYSNRISYYGTDPDDTARRDADQHDGETARFDTDPGSLKAYYDNIYNETFNDDDEPVVVAIDTALGGTGGCANPRQINDYFDDPRLGHT